MWDFVWHLRGSIRLDGVSNNEALLDRLAGLLAKQRKPVTQRDPVSLSFDAPVWRTPLGPNWLAMLIYDRGRFWIDEGGQSKRLHYELRSLHLLLFSVLATTMFFAFSLLATRDLTRSLQLGVGLGFCWLYGMNFLFAWMRAPLAIRRAVRAP